MWEDDDCFDVLGAMQQEFEEESAPKVISVTFKMDVWDEEQDETVKRPFALDMETFKHVLFHKEQIILTLKNRAGLGSFIKKLDRNGWNSNKILIVYSDEFKSQSIVEQTISSVDWTFDVANVELRFKCYKIFPETQTEIPFLREIQENNMT